MLAMLCVGMLVVLALALAPGEGEGGSKGGSEGGEGAGAGGQGAGQGGDNGGAGTGAGADAGKTVPQAEVDRIVADRLARAERKAAAERAELQAKLDAYTQAEEERKTAELSEVEKAQKAAADAKAEADAARAEAQAATNRALRAELLSQHAADLPASYKAQIAGATEEEILESIGKARETFEADRGGISKATQETVFRDVATLTPEQLTEKYGEVPEAAAVIARLTGKPVSVGSPSAAGGQPSAPAKPGEIKGGMGLAAYRDAVVAKRD